MSTTLASLIMGREKRTLHRVANATTAPSCFVSSNARKWVYRGVIRERYRLIFLRRGSVPKDKTLWRISPFLFPAVHFYVGIFQESLPKAGESREVRARYRMFTIEYLEVMYILLIHFL